MYSGNTYMVCTSTDDSDFDSVLGVPASEAIENADEKAMSMAKT